MDYVVDGGGKSGNSCEYEPDPDRDDGEDGGEYGVVKTDDDDIEDSCGVDDSVESDDYGGDPCYDVFHEKGDNSSDCANCRGDNCRVNVD